MAYSESGYELGEVVIAEDAIKKRVAELGSEITVDYRDSTPLLVGVLKGAMIFMSDLIRELDFPLEIDMMAISSYGSSTSTSGVVRILKDLDTDLTGRHVLIVEDIVDSGLTLSYLTRNLLSRNPASLEVCALIVKNGQSRQSSGIRYVGFHMPPSFVVGYGLDIGERFRNLRQIYDYKGDE